MLDWGLQDEIVVFDTGCDGIGCAVYYQRSGVISVLFVEGKHAIPTAYFPLHFEPESYLYRPSTIPGRDDSYEAPDIDMDSLEDW